MACALGYVEIAKVLLEKGADVNHTSQHSSPLIYASDYNNTELISLLLSYGADIHLVPKNFQTEAAALPLYQACLNGHKDVAEILMKSAEESLRPEKKLCLLGLLGAQVINRDQDYDSGVSFWRKALLLLEELKGNLEGEDIRMKLQELYIRESNESPIDMSQMNSSRETTVSLNGGKGNQKPHKHRHSVFNNMKLCTSIDELEEIMSSQKLLNLQGLLVLESILGPLHSETTHRISKAARHALENSDLSTACKLFLYIIECSEKKDQMMMTCEYLSQLADLLLNIFINSPAIVRGIVDINEILLAAIEFTQEVLCKVYTEYYSASSEKEPSSNFLYSGKGTSEVKVMSEMVETFMTFLRMFVDQEVGKEELHQALKTAVKIVRQSPPCQNFFFCMQSEMLRLATYGGRSASSTLYFFQEDIFPNEPTLQFLIKCGADINHQDTAGNTALHYSMDCPNPDIKIIKRLLSCGSHVDVCNKSGLTPYSIMEKKYACLQPFSYITLKCLASRVIMNFEVPYKELIPQSLEEFVPLHGRVKFEKS